MYIACALLGWQLLSYHLNIDKKNRKSEPRHNPSVKGIFENKCENRHI